MKPTALLTGLFLLALACHPLRAFADGASGSTGDPVHGKVIYTQECTGCHAMNETLVGPKHCGVFGRRAGTVPGYPYSEAMKQAGFAWDSQHLDDFLKSPITYLDGTNMGYAGLDSAKDRADVIAYLREGMDPANCALAAGKAPPSPPAANKAVPNPALAGRQAK
jgi:cytochrome c